MNCDDLWKEKDSGDNPGATTLLESGEPNLNGNTTSPRRRVGLLDKFHPDALPVFLCVAVPLLCVLASHPFADAGFIDDWSYSDIALNFARSGHFHFNGWLWATVLFQMVWGAAWIRLFGFSFDLLRIATLPFALGFVWLVYALGRKAGLRRDLACFAALITGTSPLYIPLASSFMTDVYGCFFTALCLYAAIRSGEARDDKSAVLWLWVLLVSGTVGGSNRQTVWVAPLVLIPYLFWVRRPDRRFSIQAIGAYAVCICSLTVVTRCYMPPYTALQVSREQGSALLAQRLCPALGRLTALVLAALQLTLPALLCFTPFWKKMRQSEFAVTCMAAIGLICLCVLSDSGVAPFLGPILSQYGILTRGIDALGYRPVLLNPMFRLALGLLVAFSGFYLLLRRKSNIRLSSIPKAVFVSSSLAYISLLIPAALTGFLHDRYVLPLLPALVITVLYRFQSEGSRIPTPAWLCGIAFAVYGVVITHDYAGALRARAAAAQILETMGIPRNEVSAGFEFDGWTQLQMARTIPASDEHRWNDTNLFWFWSDTKALHPEYVVINSLASDMPRAHLPKVEFTAWTPPFRRAAIVTRREDLPRTETCRGVQPCFPRPKN